MIFLAGRGWWIRLGWQWCLGTCLACAILFVSGCAKMTVPNVEGLTQDAATTAITAAKLTVGTVTQQTSNTVTTGKVISQDPASGSSVAPGSPVKLVISSGQKEGVGEQRSNYGTRSITQTPNLRRQETQIWGRSGNRLQQEAFALSLS